MNIAFDQLFQPRLIDRHDALVQVFYALFVNVKGDDAIPQVGEAGSRNQTNISNTDDADLFHFSS